jgi:hypothetical protein
MFIHAGPGLQWAEVARWPNPANFFQVKKVDENKMKPKELVQVSCTYEILSDAKSMTLSTHKIRVYVRAGRYERFRSDIFQKFQT